MRFYHLKPAAAAAALLGVLLSCARADEPKDQRQIETTSSAPKSVAQVSEKDFLDHLKKEPNTFRIFTWRERHRRNWSLDTSGKPRTIGSNVSRKSTRIGTGIKERFDFPSFDQYKVKGLEEELEEKKTGAGSDIEKLKEKVRWGDKFGAYGEHYFDFNHDGGGGDAAPKAADDADGKKEKLTQKTNQSSDALAEDPSRDRRNLLGNADVEFISDAARERIIGGATGMHGGNYKTEETGRVKRQDPAEAELLDALAQE